jgi:hypothetical protein
MKIAFWDNTMSVRGTTVSTYDYAYFNKTILGNESICLYNKTRVENHPDVVAKFEKEFKVFGVNSFREADPILEREGVDIFYVVEGGNVILNVSKVCKTVIHAVFNCNTPHGSVYAGISNWIKGNNGQYPVVPYMVNLPEVEGSMRSELGIPEEATVFGRHGGYDQFDIGYVHPIVYEVAKSNPSIYFLFVNTRPFCDPLPNIIHLGPIVNLEAKVKFINTCDAMLWARSEGETFGNAIAEFSWKNKPVFATKVGDIAHIEILGSKGQWYTESTLKQMLLDFNKEEAKKHDWNAYRDYSPEKVMKIFEEVFI